MSQGFLFASKPVGKKSIDELKSKSRKFLNFLEKYVENEWYSNIKNVDQFSNNIEFENVDGENNNTDELHSAFSLLNNIDFEDEEDGISKVNLIGASSNKKQIFDLFDNDQEVLIDEGISNKILLSEDEDIEKDKIEVNNRRQKKNFYTYAKKFILRHIDKYIPAVDNIYGKCLELGLFNIEKNEQLATKYYSIACCCNSPPGTYNLARCYELGIGGATVDLNKSLSLYKTASRLGYPKALFKIGMILLSENELDDGIENIRNSVKKIIQNGEYYNPFAFLTPFYYLGNIYTEGQFGLIEDSKYGLKIFETGAKMGCSKCMFKTGEIYRENVEWQPENMSKSLSMYNKALACGVPDALVRFSQLFLRMSLFNRNTKCYFSKAAVQGFKMTKIAAISGDPVGMQQLAKCYHLGIGIEKNLLLSMWWYEIAKDCSKNALGNNSKDDKIEKEE